MAHKLASDHDELEIKLGSPIRLFNSIGEMREYYKENSNRVFAFNPPTVDFTSNSTFSSMLLRLKDQPR